MRYTDPRLLDALASSYALGTLDGGARREFVAALAPAASIWCCAADGRRGGYDLAGSVRYDFFREERPVANWSELVFGS